MATVEKEQAMKVGTKAVGGTGDSRTGMAARWTLAVLTTTALLGASGCANAFEGSVNGAGIGALAGMGLGSLNGRMGEGAAAGAILGGLFGGWQGYQNSYYSSGGWSGGGGGRRYCD